MNNSDPSRRSSSPPPSPGPSQGGALSFGHIFANISYKGLAQFITFGLQFITSIILAQNLSPQDYGIMGFALIFVNFLSRFNDIGIGNALIQRKSIDDSVLNTAFTLRLALGACAFVAAWLVAPIARASFGDPAVTEVIRILAIGFLLGSLGFIPSSMLQRHLDFRHWIIPSILGVIVRAAVACYMAIAGYGYWSLVVAAVAGSATEAACFMSLSDARTTLTWNRHVVHELLQFGIPLFGSGLLTFILFNADNFIIGAVAGASILGYYALAFSWASRLPTLVYQVVHSVMFPALSRIQDDIARLRRTYLYMLEQLAVIGVAIHIGLFACAREFLVLVLGRGSDKWLPASHTLQILCAYGLVRLLLEPIGNVVVALGHTKILFRANLIASACEIALLYPAIRYFGISGAAAVVTVSYGIQWLVYWPEIKTQIGIPATSLLRILWPTALAGMAAFAAGESLGVIFPALSWMEFLAKVSVIAATYFSIHGLVTSWAWLRPWLRFLQGAKT